MRRFSLVVVVAVLAGASLPAGRSAAAGPPPPGRLSSTPGLIERAVALGELDRAAADRYLALAVMGSDAVPARLVGNVPWDATPVVLDLQRRLDGMAPGPERAALRSVVAPTALHPIGGVGTDRCGMSTTPMPNTRTTKHFYIEYDSVALAASLDGLSIDDYVAALETSWRKEVGRFGWPRPPAYPPNPAPGGRYHVRIDALGPVVLGLVSNGGTHAGRVGNNPHTGWNDRDADASCMVLNQDYSLFPSSPSASLKSAAAHELNHSIQFGYGALSGANEPDPAFIEGGATWMEDEVFDGANDGYHYLWPDFRDDMGEYGGLGYDYWIAWRGLTERYGTGARGGGERVMQRFWALTSKNRASNLGAMDRALRAEGTSLAAAFHAYAIAVKFNRDCRGKDRYPHCFQEGPGYVAAAGPTRPHGSIERVGGRHEDTVRDNYALAWVQIPVRAGRYVVKLTNTSTGGRLRASTACDTGSRLRVRRFAKALWPGGAGSAAFSSGGCTRAAVVITNEARTAANPSSSPARSYRVTTRR
ncbi:MAG TPA: hypothetical protein VHL78_07480 [Actinomycetota bacterium]|nr:hypothetical protein [Actinomycetota bacterium]